MSIEKKDNNGLSERLPLLRKEKGLNQQEFGYDFAKYMGRPKAYSFTTVSAWEIGRKSPKLKTLYSMASYFGVSVDYLCNLTSDRNGRADELTIDVKSKEERDLIISDSKLLIDKEDYKKYDAMPVYIVFKNMEFPNTWGILNISEQKILTLKGTLPLGQYDITLYAYPLPSEMFFNFYKIHAYSLTTLLQTKTFWVEIYSSDKELKGKYNGWYQHTPNKDGIINCNNGLLLPYTGLNVSYCAYSDPRVNG